MITYTFDLDVVPGGIPVKVPLKQYEDACTLVFNVYASKGVLTLPEGTNVSIRGTKPDENGISIGAEISGNVVTVLVDKQMTAVAGKSKYELVFANATGNEFITTSFVVMVERAALDADTLESGSIIRELAEIQLRQDEIIEAARTAVAKTEELDEMYNTVVAANENVNTKAAEVDEKARMVAAIKTEADTLAKKALEVASNAENEVAECQNSVQVLTEAGNMMKLEISSKCDGAYVEQGYLYLTSNGSVVAGPLGPFSGGGGGSGGSGGNNASLTVTNTSGWLAKTVVENAPCNISLTWSSIEDDMPTGNGSLSVTVNGSLKTIMDIAQGSVIVDVSKFLSIGSNVVKIAVSDVYGNSRTINFSATLVSISISSSFDSSVAYTGAILFTYTPVGSVQKTVHFELDGEEIGTKQTSVSGRQQSYTIPAQTHGVHKFRCYFNCVVNGETITSNVLYYEIICLEDLRTDKIIASNFDITSAKQYETLTIEYIVYDPLAMEVPIVISANGVVMSNQVVDRKVQSWSYRADEPGQLIIEIASGDVSKQFTIEVDESDIQVEAETEGLELFLSSYGRSNNEENPAVWSFNGIEATFTNFNFTSDGWQMDKDGATALRVSGDARLSIPFKIFQNDFRTSGKTVEFMFSTRDVRNYDAEIISCYSGNRGFKVTAQQIMLQSEQSKVSYQFKDNELVRVSFVVEKRSENRLIYLYINGICSQVVQYPANDDFSQAEPVNISIGSNDCTADIYCIRVYNNDLTRMQVLNNWIADTTNVTDMLDRYTRNNVYDAYGNITIANLPKNLPYLVLECPELPQFKGDKKTISGRYVDPVNPNKSFTFTGAQIDVQGTSSAGYERKNYKIKFKEGFAMEVSGATASGFRMRDDSIATSTFTFKADVASSEGCNNVELVRLYNDACPYKTPAQKANPSVRQGIDGFPIVIFWNNGENEIFLGKYNFNNDKGTPEVFGFADGDESWEIRNNTSERALFKSDDFSGDAWKNDFEARYPEDSTDVTNLAAFAAWIVTTDTTAATNEALPEAIEYDGVSYTNDTAEYRLAKFRNELSNWAELDSALFYYLFTELFLMVDSRAKNAFPSFIGKEVSV